MINSTTSPDGTFERTADGGLIRFERHLAFPIDDVWDAITNPARLSDWWLPFDADITIELTEGGLMEMRSTGDDEPITITCQILRVEPPTLLEHTHADPGSVVRWELEPMGSSATVLRLSHHVPDPESAIENCYLVGLHTSLERLVPSLSGRPISWDWARFAEHQNRYADQHLASRPSPV
jgi:uncharacterized protein YndB with AHSA1/START domain